MKNLEVPLQVAIMTWFNNLQRKELNSKLNIKPRYTVGPFLSMEVLCGFSKLIKNVGRI
jgi:hypothetical protein